ncbi:hypothetical protein PSCICJ_16450 [Pseudomonas cichorii]|nr:hypothetical protein PSCICJ_16450 [Pseudomonas cichorii]
MLAKGPVKPVDILRLSHCIRQQAASHGLCRSAAFLWSQMQKPRCVAGAFAGHVSDRFATYNAAIAAFKVALGRMALLVSSGLVK